MGLGPIFEVACGEKEDVVDDNLGSGISERIDSRLNWPTLLKRVFAVEVLVCPRCAGPRRILGAVTEPHAVRRLLATLGLAAEPPPAGVAAPGTVP